MQWNGTYLGQFKKNNILQKIKFQREIYWEVSLTSSSLNSSNSDSNITFFCLAKVSKHTLPCILDEFKPLFSLEKIGTHWCKIGNRIYILYQVNDSENCSIEVDPKVRDILKEDKNFLVDYSLINEAKRIYTFREIFGITFSTHTSLRIRNKIRIESSRKDENLDEKVEDDSIKFLIHQNPYLLSFREPNVNLEKSTVSKTILKQLFKNNYAEIQESIRQILRQILPAKSNFMIGMENKLLPIVKNIDHNNCLYVDAWISRMLNFVK